MGALGPVGEGNDDFLEILPELYARDRKEWDSIHGGVGPGRDMIVGTCWHQWYAEFLDASLTGKCGNSARGRRNHAKPHHAPLCASREVP
jgi:hypothetical protein